MKAGQVPTSKSASKSDLQCRLTTLPAEIRNQIYEYALTVSVTVDLFWRCNGVLHMSSEEASPRLYESFKPRPEGGFNQLRFTCRLLHRETTLLELKYNAIRFGTREDNRIGPAEWFSTFIASCAPTKASKLTRITLDNETNTRKTCTIEPPRHLVAVAEFCRQNPHANVSYIPNQMTPNWYSAKTVVELGVVINLVVRGRDLRRVILPGAEFEFENGYLRGWVEERDVAGGLDVPNLRFWPLHGAKKLNEKDFAVRLVEQTRFMVDACVELAKEWCEWGI